MPLLALKFAHFACHCPCAIHNSISRMPKGHIRKVVNGIVAIASNKMMKLALKYLSEVRKDWQYVAKLFMAEQVGAAFAGSGKLLVHTPFINQFRVPGKQDIGDAMPAEVCGSGIYGGGEEIVLE